MLQHILDQDGNIIMLDHVMIFEQQTHEHNGLFYSRITAKMRDSSSEYVVGRSYPNKEDRDAAHAKAWRVLSTILPTPLVDFSKPIRIRKR